MQGSLPVPFISIETHKLRFGRLVFEKSLKRLKNGQNQKFDHPEGHNFLCEKV